MLNKLTVKNLKCFSETIDIPLAPLTLIYGENSSGKSTILLAIQILRSSILKHKLTQRSEYSYKGIINNHDIKRKISIGLTSFNSYGMCMRHHDEGIAGYSFSSTLLWSKEKQKIEHKALDISEITQQYCDNSTGTWKFLRQGNDMVAPINIYRNLADYYRDDLIKILTDNRMAILEGIEKQIEADIMEEFLEENPKEYDRFIDNMKRRHIGTARGKMMRIGNSGPIESDEAYNTCRKREDTEIALNKGIAEEWRRGLPGWIKNCPPSWRSYRESLSFIEKAENLRTTRYKDVIDFCSQPNEEYFATNPAKMTLKQGDVSFSNYESSRIFTKDIIGLFEPILEIDYDPCGDKKPQVSLLSTTTRNNIAGKASQLEATVSRCQSSHFNATASDIQETLRRIVVVAPLRQRAKRIYSSVSISSDAEQSDIDGTTVPLVLKDNKELLERVNEWLTRLGVDYTVEIQTLDDEYFKLLLRDTRDNNAPLVQYADVGFGISQILPIVVKCLSSQQSTILIEQPELHIHPRLQAELGSLFAEAINTYHHQLIIETHSEHLMLRVQRLIRNKKIHHLNVSVLYVSRGSSGSSVQRLELNEDAGFLESWPNGFFPERLKELL